MSLKSHLSQTIKAKKESTKAVFHPYTILSKSSKSSFNGRYFIAKASCSILGILLFKRRHYHGEGVKLKTAQGEELDEKKT